MKLLQKLKSLLFKSKPPEKIPLWTGVCDCCKREIKSYDRAFSITDKVECISCLAGISEAGRKREEERRQIDLIKRAIKELTTAKPQLFTRTVLWKH